MSHHLISRHAIELRDAQLTASLYGSVAAVFLGIALMYLVYCFVSRSEQYRSQRIGASLIVLGQLIVFAYWQLQLHLLLHLGILGTGSLIAGAAVTFIGLIVMAQKQSSRTWLWF